MNNSADAEWNDNEIVSKIVTEQRQKLFEVRSTGTIQKYWISAVDYLYYPNNS